ncbi:MAG: recombination mediator RecR [Verrucomicrobiales bacterium]
MPIDYPDPVRLLIAHLKALPGIGPRSAERIAIWMLQGGGRKAPDLARAIDLATSSIAPCPTCGFFSESGKGCALCEGADAAGRDAAVICVVEQPTDVLPLERTGAFKGFYHVLGGRISPLDNISPDDLRIAGLLDRLRLGGVEEVILATGSDVEGEATAHFLAEEIRPLGIKASRLAQGLPAGGGLEHADELTLFRALDGRRTL